MSTRQATAPPRSTGRAREVLLVVATTGAALFLWMGIPIGWLWIGSQLQESMGIGSVLMIVMVGALASVFALLPLLAWLNHRLGEITESRGRRGRHSAFEGIMVVTAGLTLAFFVAWFFFLSGGGLGPLQIAGTL